MEDIDQSLYPAPFYLHHKNGSCDKISTFYVDSLLRVSYKELEKKNRKLGVVLNSLKLYKEY